MRRIPVYRPSPTEYIIDAQAAEEISENSIHMKRCVKKTIMRLEQFLISNSIERNIFGA